MGSVSTPAIWGSLMTSVAVTPSNISNFLPRWGSTTDPSTYGTGNNGYVNGLGSQVAYGMSGLSLLSIDFQSY